MLPVVIINHIVTALLALVSYALWTVEDTSIFVRIITTMSAVLSIPGVGKLIYRKKYGIPQRILHWIIVVVTFLIGFLPYVYAA